MRIERDKEPAEGEGQPAEGEKKDEQQPEPEKL